jgi:hypothetical protein
MKPISSALLGLLALLAAGAATPAPTTETIVLIRHGEKPAAGLGQLDCQGLNRALALPPVITREFGRPDAIYVPDPSETKPDQGIAYDYVRPLATVEPTAIAMGLPVHASIGGTHIDLLQQALEAPAYRGSLVLVAWEHAEIVKLVRRLMTDHGGTPNAAPEWKGSDFDSIYIVRLTWTGDKATAAFERRAEHLDGQSTVCPGPAPHG